MFEITLMNEKKKSIKLLIIEALMNSQTLSVMKLKNVLAKHYNKKVTYQAVHKAVKEMYRDNVLIKMGKEYIISEEYVDRMEKFSKELRKAKKSGLNIFEKKEIEKITFENLWELYIFIIQALAINYLTDEYKSNYVWIRHLLPLSTSVKPKKDILHNWLKRSKSFVLIKEKTFMDRILSIYAKKKFDMTIKLGINTEMSYELIVINETVMQIFLPKKILESLDNLYSNVRKVVSPDIVEVITEMAFINAPINVVIIRNKDIANQFKQEIMNHF